MSELARVTLPFPPSVNTLFPANRKTGRRFVSRAYKSWKLEAWALIKQARIPRIADRVDIEIQLTAKDRRARDADNYVKAVVDSLVEGGVIPDDNSRHVRSVRPVWREHNKAEAGALVVITRS